MIKSNLKDETLLVEDNYDFYKILEDKTDINVINELGSERASKLAILRNEQNKPGGYTLERIIVSPKRDNSAIIYLYTVTPKEGE